MQRDWRIYFGLTITSLWLILGFAYIATTVGWSNFLKLPAEQMGSFLEGAFAPLAFLWLVIGYFLQQKELEQNTAALRAQAKEIERTVEQAALQSEKMAESEIHARQQAFLRVSQAVSSQLGTISAFLYLSSQGTAAQDGPISRGEQAKLFEALGTNDTEVFSRRLIELNLSTMNLDERLAYFYGTEVRARHTNNFIYTFERLLKRAERVDTDEIIIGATKSSGHGLLYHIMKRHQERAPAELTKYEPDDNEIRV